MDSELLCPHCHHPMIYDPELEDWRHHPTNDTTHQCYLRRQGQLEPNPREAAGDRSQGLGPR
jgi:hypothetical protein